MQSTLCVEDYTSITLEIKLKKPLTSSNHQKGKNKPGSPEVIHIDGNWQELLTCWWQSYLLGTSMLMMQVSSSSPYRSVHVARSQRWSWDRQYPTKSTLYFCDASPNVSPSSVCLSFTGARMNGGVYRRRHSGLCRLGGQVVRINDGKINVHTYTGTHSF